MGRFQQPTRQTRLNLHTASSIQIQIPPKADTLPCRNIFDNNAGFLHPSLDDRPVQFQHLHQRSSPLSLINCSLSPCLLPYQPLQTQIHRSFMLHMHFYLRGGFAVYLDTGGWTVYWFWYQCGYSGCYFYVPLLHNSRICNFPGVPARALPNPDQNSGNRTSLHLRGHDNHDQSPHHFILQLHQSTYHVPYWSNAAPQPGIKLFPRLDL